MKPLERDTLFVRAIRGETTPREDGVVTKLRESDAKASAAYDKVSETLVLMEKLKERSQPTLRADFTINLMSRVHAEPPHVTREVELHAGQFRHRIALGVLLIVGGIAYHLRTIAQKPQSPHELLGIYTVLGLLFLGLIAVGLGLYRKNLIGVLTGLLAFALAVAAMQCSWFFP